VFPLPCLIVSIPLFVFCVPFPFDLTCWGPSFASATYPAQARFLLVSPPPRSQRCLHRSFPQFPETPPFNPLLACKFCVGFEPILFFCRTFQSAVIRITFFPFRSWLYSFSLFASVSHGVRLSFLSFLMIFVSFPPVFDHHQSIHPRSPGARFCVCSISDVYPGSSPPSSHPSFF